MKIGQYFNKRMIRLLAFKNKLFIPMYFEEVERIEMVHFTFASTIFFLQEITTDSNVTKCYLM